MPVPQPLPDPDERPVAAPTPPAATARVAKGFHIPSLDGIRAVAFSVVFLSHAVTQRIPGGFGVTVFFFLSGYLITTLLRVEHERTGTISLSNFYARRALRIFPNFYLVLAGATLLALAGGLAFVGGRPDGWGLFWQAAYGNNYRSIFHGDLGTVRGSGVLWSLAVEEHFYLVFPVLFLLMLKASARPWVHVAVLGGLCALCLLWRGVVVFATDLPAEWYTYKASEARFDSMLFGAMLALVGNPALDNSRRGDGFWLWVATPLGLGLLLVTFVVRDDRFRWTARYTLQGLALMPLFVAAIRCHRSPVFAWLGWRPVRYVGVLTYTLYLVHLIVLDRVQDFVEPRTTARKLLGAAVAFGISLLIAVAMHHWVERPLGRWRKRLHAERGGKASRGVAVTPLPAGAA